MSNHLISVLLPVYNAELYLKEAIDSVLNQTFQDFELIIINDCSTDNSPQIIKSYDDPRIITLNNESNSGIAMSLNKGIQKAQGKYLARMDADDICLPERLQTQFDFLEKNQNIDIVGSFFKKFGHVNKIQKKPVSSERCELLLLAKSPFCHPSIMMRKSLFTSNHNLYDQDFVPSEDYKLFSDCCANQNFYNLPKILLKYRTFPPKVKTLKYGDRRNRTSYHIRKLNFDNLNIPYNESSLQNYNNLLQGLPGLNKSDLNAYLIFMENITLTLKERDYSKSSIKMLRKQWLLYLITYIKRYKKYPSLYNILKYLYKT